MLIFLPYMVSRCKTQNVVIHRVSVFCSIMIIIYSTVMLRNTQWFFPDTNFFIYIIFDFLAAVCCEARCGFFLKKSVIINNMIITKPMQRDLDAAVADAWEVCGQKRICPRTADYELPDSWKPDWWSEELTLSELTPDMVYELKETTRLYNEEFEAIWQSYYEDYLAWLEEEREFESYLRTESVYW